MLEFENRFPGGFPFGKERQEIYQAENDDLRSRLGQAAWWDRWQVEPEYEERRNRVKGAVRPNPSSSFYAAPSLGSWGIFNEASDSVLPLEDGLSKTEAIEGAARLAAGRKTYQQERRNLRDFQAVAVLVILIGVALIAFIEIS